MLLFGNDWRNYPNAIIDTRTTNESFLRLASLYRSMGIRNHAFILALLDPTLQGVDPHSPYLSKEQMARIAIESKRNVWFFLRCVARAPAIGGTDSTPVEANRGNIALFWLFLNHVFTILIQPRQTGKSFSTDVLIGWLLDIATNNTKINLLTKDDTLRRANIQRIKDIVAEFPPYLQQKRPDDLNNTEEITVNALNNRYTTHVPQTSPKNALKVGRGLTTPIFQIDEAPFQPNISIALPAALAAMGAAVDKAEAEGAPYGTILTTTAGKKDDKDGRYIYNILTNSSNFTEAFFDSENRAELFQMIKGSSRQANVVRVAVVMNHRQLGKTDEWLMRKLSDSLQSGEDANRDFFNVWTSGSQSNPLPVQTLERIVGSVRDVQYTEISKQGQSAYVTRWYVLEEEIYQRMANGHYILSMDTSEASGGDDISLIVTDIVTREVIAAGTYNETNLIEFSKWVCQWFIKFPKLTAIIERRSTGAMIIDYLLMRLPELGIDPFKRLFNTVVQEYQQNAERYREIQTPMARRDPNIYVRYKKTFGYTTSGSGEYSRSALYSTTLQLAAKLASDKIYDKTLIDQISGLVTRNGRVDHEEGEHDDMVVGFLLGQWLILFGINLSYYGIDISLLRAINAPQSVDDHQKHALQSEQNELRQQIEQYTQRLKMEMDEYVSLRLEQHIRYLMKQVVLDDNEIFSVDELFKQVKDLKRKQKREAAYSQSNPFANPLADDPGFYYNQNGPWAQF